MHEDIKKELAHLDKESRQVQRVNHYASAFEKTITKIEHIYHEKYESFREFEEKKKRKKNILYIARKIHRICRENQEFFSRARRHSRHFQSIIEHKLRDALSHTMIEYVTRFNNEFERYMRALEEQATIQVMEYEKECKTKRFLWILKDRGSDWERFQENMARSFQAEETILEKFQGWSDKRGHEVQELNRIIAEYHNDADDLFRQMQEHYKHATADTTNKKMEMAKEFVTKMDRLITKFDSPYIDMRIWKWIYEVHVEYLKDPSRVDLLAIMAVWHGPNLIRGLTAAPLTVVLSIVKSARTLSKKAMKANVYQPQ